MPSQTIRITAADHAVLSEMARQSGMPMSAVLSQAIRTLRRAELLRETNEAFSRLKQDKAAWEEEMRERRLWERTLADGKE